MLRLLRPLLVNALSNTLPKTLTKTPVSHCQTRNLAALCPPISLQPLRLLQPSLVAVNHTAGYKVKGHLKKRCEHCYYVKRRGRLFVECKVKPRHKQMQMLSKEKIFAED